MRQPRGSKPKLYKDWQLKLASSLVDYGLNVQETCYVLSIKCPNVLYRYKKVNRDTRPPLNGFRTRLASNAWNEARDYILAAARLDGATLEEIAKLAGFSGRSYPGNLMRRKFPSVPRGAVGRPRKEED